MGILSPSAAPVADDLVCCITRFLNDVIARNGENADNIEIEAKFGLLTDRTTNDRIQLPVLSECIVNAEGWTAFVSDMPVAYHRRFNELLNRRFSDRSLGWKYAHTKTVDQIYPNQTRVTVHPETGALLSAQRKRKLAHLAIFQPNASLDVRISVSTEDAVSTSTLPPATGPGVAFLTTRRKDRIAYETDGGLFSVDLTQVVQQDGGPSSSGQTKHELELEVKRPRELLASPDKLRLFVDVLRELCRAI